MGDIKADEAVWLRFHIAASPNNMTTLLDQIDGLEADLALHENEDASYASELNSTRSALVVAEDRIAALEVRNKRMEEALRSFGIYDDPDCPDEQMSNLRVSFGVMRKAREALESKP